MSNQAIRTIAIVGGNTVGWVVAAALSQGLQARGVQIVVVQSAHDTPGAVAESTLPSTTIFQHLHGMDERDLMRGTRATFKLGSLYEDWWGAGQPWFGSLGRHGAGIGFLQFQHYYAKAQAMGQDAPFGSYSLNAVAAQAGKFTHPQRGEQTPLSTLVYGHHLDGAWYCLYLRGFAEYHGARCVEGELAGVSSRDNGRFIESLKLADGSDVRADLFIDCTGPKARLIGDALGVEFEDWSAWLPVDRVVSLNLPSDLEPAPYTRLRAIEQGFIRDIPLQDRTVRELHFRTGLTADQEAIEVLRALSPMAGSAPPILRDVRCGQHKEIWAGNCVAMGPAAAGMEALAIGDLQLAETLALKLLGLFPDRNCEPVLRDEFNRQAGEYLAHGRDYNILHYQAATHSGAAFWDHANDAPAPASVSQRIELFESQAELPAVDEETFGIGHWVALLIAQGYQPQAYNPYIDSLDWALLHKRFETMRASIKDAAAGMPSQRDYLLQYLRPPQARA